MTRTLESSSAISVSDAVRVEDCCAPAEAPSGLPPWIQAHWDMILVVLAGLFLVLGFLSEKLLESPQWTPFTFYLLAYAAGGYKIANQALPALLRGRLDTDILMLAAALGAAVLGEWAEGGFLLFLFALGHAGEHYALDRARNAVNALGELMPRSAQVRRNGGLAEVAVESIQLDEIVLIRPGDRVPVDGEIIEGRSSVNQAPVTGESVPVNKRTGDRVFAGTINQEGALSVRVMRLAADNTLSRVIRMVQEAQSRQSPSQRFASSFTRRFVPGVLILTVLVALIPPLMGWMSWGDGFYRAMLLLVAASPCALAIGTPAAVLAGIGQAARNGILIKGGVHLENLGALQVMAFDKTGTLSEGRFEVTDVVPVAASSAEQILAIAAALEEQSSHPLARAIASHARAGNIDLPTADKVENLPGQGIRSSIDGEPVLVGSPELFKTQNQEDPDSKLSKQTAMLEKDGKTVVVVGQNGSILGIIGLADRPRTGARQALERLSRIGIRKLVMLTGDNESVARQVGAQLGIDDVRAGLMPSEKLEAIRALESKHGSIAMTGDGVNDAPALATATVGIAMGGAGTAVALETADVALIGDDLSKLPFAVGLSRASRAIIRQNHAIALGVIGLLVLSSVAGLIQLSGAVILHEGSTLVVVANALRLLAYKESP